MNGNYIAGVGIVNDDFSITNKDLASFDDLQNAKLFLQAKYDNTFNKLIYLDVKGEGRYLYDGKELYIPGDNTKLMMSGYNVSADYYEEGIDGKEEWNHSVERYTIFGGSFNHYIL